MSVTVFFTFEASAGNSEALLSVLRQGRDFGRTVDGCEAYDVYRGKDDPHKLVMVERWTSAEAQADHFEKNVLASGVLDRAVALMAEPPAPPVYFLLD